MAEGSSYKDAREEAVTGHRNALKRALKAKAKGVLGPKEPKTISRPRKKRKKKKKKSRSPTVTPPPATAVSLASGNSPPIVPPRAPLPVPDVVARGEGESSLQEAAADEIFPDDVQPTPAAAGSPASGTSASGTSSPGVPPRAPSPVPGVGVDSRDEGESSSGAIIIDAIPSTASPGAEIHTASHEAEEREYIPVLSDDDDGVGERQREGEEGEEVPTDSAEDDLEGEAAASAAPAEPESVSQLMERIPLNPAKLGLLFGTIPPPGQRNAFYVHQHIVQQVADNAAATVERRLTANRACKGNHPNIYHVAIGDSIWTRSAPGDGGAMPVKITNITLRGRNKMILTVEEIGRRNPIAYEVDSDWAVRSPSSYH